MPRQTSVVPWQAPNGVEIPADVEDAKSVVPYAVGLPAHEKDRVVQAMQAGLYEMGAEFVWHRSMARLRVTLSRLGMPFISEMLGRDDISEVTAPEAVLTDFDTIRLAEALGVVNTTGAIRLRHGFELLSHFASGRAEGQLRGPEAMGVILTCVQYVLGEQDISVAVDFSRLRERLLSEAVPSNDPQIEQLSSSPPFFLSTTLRILLAAIRSEHGARLQHALGNVNTLLPTIWDHLPESDRWSLGEAYAEASAAGNSSTILDLKRALLKIRGFDYVPESLRSSTYKKAAQAIMTAHFSWNNYLLEGAPTRQLAALGTVIPKPAVGECLQAYLSVYLGNRYGHSYDAAPVASAELRKVAQSNWLYYFDVYLRSDDIILAKLDDDKPAARFCQIVTEIEAPAEEQLDKSISRLLHAAKKGQRQAVMDASRALIDNLKRQPSAA